MNEEKTAKLSVKEFSYNSKDDPKSQDRIEKMQESLNIFKKHLEKIKNKQAVMNSEISEIKNTLEGINSRITEAEQINELEGRMVEITSKVQNKKKANENN